MSKTKQSNTTTDNAANTTTGANGTSNTDTTAQEGEGGSSNPESQEPTLPELTVTESKLEKTSKLKDILSISIQSSSTIIYKIQFQMLITNISVLNPLDEVYQNEKLNTQESF